VSVKKFKKSFVKRVKMMRVNKMLSKSGFTLVEIMIVVAIIGIVVTIAIPNINEARTNAQKNACIANLKQIDSAKMLYALDNGVLSGGACTMQNLVPMYIKSAPTCPSGGTYTVAVLGTDPACDVAGHVLP